MKAKDIKQGEVYHAKVSGKLVLVRVDKIYKRPDPFGGKVKTRYGVTNLCTDRKITFRSAQRFRGAVIGEPVPETYGEEQEKLADRLHQKKDTGVDKAPHLIVEARAGTGKTTTLVEGLKRIKELPSDLTPSPQQAAVWEAMEQSKGHVQTICFVAFNKSIATELQQRVPQGCDAMTMHSMGFKAVQRHFGRVRVNSYRVQDIISELLERDIRELRRSKLDVLRATEKLVGLCKMNLVSEKQTRQDIIGVLKEYPGIDVRPGEITYAVYEDTLTEIVAHYDVDLNTSRSEIFDLVPRVLERCKDVVKDGCIDFNDMIWLPIALNLNVYRYDLLLIDECQDLNRCQQELAVKAGRRLILCGDTKQAIYGFAGADSQSMSRMTTQLKATDRGCQVLPLTVTRRCGKAIVKEAKRIVPDFEAHESCCKGLVHTAKFKDTGDDKVAPLSESCYRGYIGDKDMVLCRCNAPLVSECFKFLREGRRANIQGRDVGQGLISTINKMKATDVAHLESKLSDWLQNEQRKENAKRNPSEARLIALQDRHDCLSCFMEEQQTVEEVIKRIKEIFTDDKHGEGIKLSSVHKAKGLEAKRVFILQPEGATMPHPMAKSKWQREQEMNLLYVAITRAIEELIYVS